MQQLATPNLDPTVPAPMVNVAEYAFEGRFEEWAEQAEFFEYSRAANPIGSGLTRGCRSGGSVPSSTSTRRPA